MATDSFDSIFSTLGTGVLVGTFCFMMLICVIQIAAMWRIFTKAGEHGWAALIPIYSDYVQFKVGWKTKYFLVSFILGMVGGILSGYSTASTEGGGLLVALTCFVSLASAVISVLWAINLARHFGCSDAFAIGIILIPIVFLSILAFGDKQYIPDVPTVDIPGIN